MPGNPTERVIYDLGANNGDDLPYYLLKADRVVAVEANPFLADHIRERFRSEIGLGRLEVLSCVVTAEEPQGDVDFYIHRTNHVLSQFPPPSAQQAAEFDRGSLPARSVLDIIDEFGPPHYVKIDLEHYDAVILRALFEHGLRPAYISAEAHTVEVFALMVALGGYAAFKIVDGRTVSRRYRDHPISTATGERAYSFPEHSAGPFGDDITGPWLSAEAFSRWLAAGGLGWRDVHATNNSVPVDRRGPSVADLFRLSAQDSRRHLTHLGLRARGRIVRLVRGCP